LEAAELRYGPATAWLQGLGVFEAYRSPWFLALVAALLLNALACTVQRLPPLWRSLTSTPAVRRPAAFYQGFARRAEWAVTSPEQGITVAVETLERHRFHPQVEQDITTGQLYLYAERGRWSQAGTLVSHLVAMVLVLAVVCRPALGWQESDVTLLPGEVHAVGNGTGLEVRLGAPLTEQRPGVPLAILQGTSALTRTVSINHPLSYQGVAFHLMGYGPAAEIDAPEGVFGVVLGGSQAQEVALPAAGLAMRVTYQSEERVLYVEAMGAGGDMLGSGVVAHNQEIEVRGVPITLRLTNYSQWQVSRDRTFGLAVTSAILLLAGVVISLWVPHRRLWLRVDGEGRAWMVGAGEWGPEFDIISGEVHRETTAGMPGASAQTWDRRPLAGEGDG
jgi:cytochrome c biogenesis protein